MKLTYNPKTDIDRLNLLNSDEKVDLELGLLRPIIPIAKIKVISPHHCRLRADRCLQGRRLERPLARGTGRHQCPAGCQYGLERHPLSGVFNQEYNVSLSGVLKKLPTTPP